MEAWVEARARGGAGPWRADPSCLSFTSRPALLHFRAWASVSLVKEVLKISSFR